MPRHTQAIIHLDHIRHNYQLAQQWAPDSQNMAIIKANAYGHGIVEVANALSPVAPAFGVAILEEAIVLREAGIKNPILVLQGVNASQDYQLACELDLWTTIHNLDQLKALLASPLKRQLKVWLKLDTGMHRLGLNLTEFQSAAKASLGCPWIDNELVISSHYSCASQIDNIVTMRQFELFNQMLEAVDILQPAKKSIANSPAIIGFPQSNLDWNRPGIMLYGVSMFDGKHASDKLLKPAMSFESEVVAVRKVKQGDAVGYGEKWHANSDATIATVAVGYADGYPRQAVSGTPVLVNGKRAELVGSVSMDLISINVSELSQVKLGDKVELWGESLPVAEVARKANTIGYDLVSGVSPRVPRIYR